MADKEKLEKIKSLADKMYRAMQNLTTDTTPIRKAMYEYRQFIIQHLNNEAPTRDDLEEAAENHALQCHSKKASVATLAASIYDFRAGANWQKNNLWKDAQGDDLPEIDREVVVFTQNFPDDAGIMRIAIAHRPNPNGWDGKSLSTGKVEHFEPKTYDKGGWNIPDVKYWLDAELPEGIE